MTRRRVIAAAITALALSLLTAGTPATQPATRPATQPAAAVDSQIGRWFDQLSDADPSVRDDARQSLMGLNDPGDLPKLRAVVQAARPVRPAQADALHEIVCHDYLAATPYEQYTGLTMGRYVMGLRWPPDLLDGNRMGVPVVDRWPGFPARRWLRDGDLILGVYVHPDEPLLRPPNTFTHSPQDLIDLFQRPEVYRDVVLAILREGREIRVPIRLVPKPGDNQGRVVAWEGFIEARRREAETYWQTQFVPLLRPAGHPDARVPPDLG